MEKLIGFGPNGQKSKTPQPSEMFDDPDGMTFMGIAVNKETDVESTDYTDYQWSPIPGTTASTTIDQNNKIRVLDIPIDELTSLDDVGVAAWISENGIIVSEDELIGIQVTGIEEPVIPTLDQSIDLTLAVGAITQTTAVINWNPNGDNAIVRYEVFYVRTKGGAYDIKSLGNVLTTTLTALESGVEYEVYAIAYDTEGNTKQSNLATFTTDEVFVASTPNIQPDAVTDTTIDLSWNIEASFNADRYELYQVGTGKIYDGPNKSIHITGLTQNTTYQFYVKAFSGLTASNDSATIDVDTLLTVNPPLTAPTLNYLSNGVESLKFSIGIPDLEVSRVTSYQLQYRVFGSTNWISKAINLDNLQTLSGLQEDTTYELQVRSSDGTVFSNWSTILMATTAEDIKARLLLDILDPGNPEGILTILDGEPNGSVTVQVTVRAKYLSNLSEADIHFNTLNVDVIHTDDVSITLDQNGVFSDTFAINTDEVGTEVTIEATLIQSTNGIDPDNNSKSVTYIKPF